MKQIVRLLLSALVFGTWPGVAASFTSSREEVSAALLRAEKDPNSEFMLSVWQSGDGLPGNVVDDLEETPDGYLWLGTHQGLVRFDGLHFQTFFATPAGARYGARMGPLAVDEQGRLWLAPDQVGLFCRQAGTFTEVLTNSSLLSARAESLCSDRAGGLLWVDANGGLGRLEVGASQAAQSLEGFASGLSRWVRDYQGQLWLVDPRGIRLFQPRATAGSRWRRLEPAGGPLLTAAPRRAGGLWIASQGHLRWLLADGQSRTETAFPWLAGGTRVTCLLEDSQHRLWVGTASQGLFCYSQGQFQQVVPTASTILCLREDREGNLWAGTRGAGLLRVRARQFFVQDLRSGLSGEFVRSLCEDAAGRVWMALAERGLGWWQQGAWHSVGPAENWPGHEALCVLPARQGGVWVSTARRGLWRCDQEHFGRCDLGPEPPKEPAVDLLEDRQSRLWMVTDNAGLFCLQSNHLASYSVAQGLPSDHIRCLVEDEAGQLWAGDWEGALARFQGQRWELIRPPSGHRDAVRSLVAAQGALWMGTSAGGLLRFRDGQTARLSPEQGLPDVTVEQLLFDGHGSLWGSTPHKLFRLPLSQLQAVLDGQQETVDAITYGRGDGLPDVSFANWCDPRCARARDGQLWFATANGAIHFQPAHLQVSQLPAALLEQILLDGKPLASPALQQLRPGPGRLEFRFTAPCLTAPERVRFRYQLTGVDSTWVEAGTARAATYASLPAGHHRFQVVASSPEGLWSAEVASVTLAVHPYFWQTPWFLAALAATTAGGGVWGARRATVRRLNRRLDQLRQQHALERERARIAQDIHDELGANLTSIGLVADLGRRHQSDPAALSRDLDQIARTARESVAAMDAIVWALNPRNDSLDHFANYLAQFTREFFRPSGLRTRLELPTELPAHVMAPEVRHQLFLLVKESFNNLVRHAQASEVRLEMVCEPDALRLRIADNGRGLPAQAPAEGQDGLTNLRQRIERLGGTLHLESAPGQGTSLDFVLPWAKLKAS